MVDDDGTVTGCRYLNQYLLDAHTQSGLDLKSMRRSHIYHLGRLLRFSDSLAPSPAPVTPG